MENTASESSQKSPGKIPFITILLILLGMIVVGMGGGYLISSYTRPPAAPSGKTTQTETAKMEKGAGILDKKRFPDKAEGKLKEGGIEGEGNFHLERPGGESQNVYLTSSIVDLSQYVGKKVRVWGETFQGQTAGWLMDVGYIEIL